jgi:pimeloyl-ACP methyl ester carboxylesterase
MTPLRVLENARAAVRIVGRAATVQAYEVGALASTAAMATLRLVGGGSEPASTVSPHTKAHAAPTACPVLLVHGFGGTKSSWSVIAQALSDRGITVDTIAYSPLGNSVEQLADELVAAVDRTLSQTGADKVQVGHSLGGVVIAQAIAGAWSGWSTPSSPWAPLSADRPGRTCCRSGICSGRCDQVRLYCAA